MTEIKNYTKSVIKIGEQYGNFLNYVPIEKRQHVIIITDSNINRIYGKRLLDFPIIEIGTGEQIKTIETVDFIIDELLNHGADRHSYLIAIGGGIVCDITGYVASIFMRGISFGYVSTSLLSQVDASTGGKTGINFKGFKNLIGCFNHPDFVICDLNMLKTLPYTELSNGIAEVVKHALIADAEMFEFLELNYSKILELDEKAILYIIRRSIEIKTAVVEYDEKEKGERKKLNLGHTFGHAIESLSGLPHGQAVSIGLVLSAELSEQLGICEKGLKVRLVNLLQKFRLPTITSLSNIVIIEAMKKDKKRIRNKVDFIYIKKIGEVIIQPIAFEELIRNNK